MPKIYVHNEVANQVNTNEVENAIKQHALRFKTPINDNDEFYVLKGRKSPDVFINPQQSNKNAFSFPMNACLSRDESEVDSSFHEYFDNKKQFSEHDFVIQKEAAKKQSTTELKLSPVAERIFKEGFVAEEKEDQQKISPKEDKEDVFDVSPSAQKQRIASKSSTPMWNKGKDNGSQLSNQESTAETTPEASNYGTSNH